MPKKLPLVCIIILNWNGGQIMKDCIKSLKKTSYKNYKTTIIDNGSLNKKEVDELKKINKKIEIVYLDKNYGYTVGTRVGYEYAIKKYNPAYMVEMNNDIITIQKEWLTLQIKELEKHQEYGISSGLLLFKNGEIQAVNEKSERGIFEKDSGQYDYVTKMDYVRGACLVVKRSVVNAIGYPDDHLFYGPSDIDYCYRAKKAGFKIIQNGFSKSIHLGGYSGFLHPKDYIFFPQTEGMLIFNFRYCGLLKGLKKSARFFARAFVTRKDPFISKNLSKKSVSFL